MLPEPIRKLTEWKTAGEGRSWQVTSWTSWGAEGVRLTVNWKFGASQLGSFHHSVSAADIEAAQADPLAAAVDRVLQQFADWEVAYAASKAKPPETT